MKSPQKQEITSEMYTIIPLHSQVDIIEMQLQLKLKPEWNKIQVNLCQRVLFLHQLTHNMTTDCSLNYKFNTWKFQAQTWGEHVLYIYCFWHSERFLYTTCSPHLLQKEELLINIYRRLIKSAEAWIVGSFLFYNVLFCFRTSFFCCFGFFWESDFVMGRPGNPSLE